MEFLPPCNSGMSYMGDNMFTARSRHVMALLLGFTVITSVTALNDKVSTLKPCHIQS